MTIYEEIKQYMMKSPRSRERANKNKFIAWLLFDKYHIKISPINDHEQLAMICETFSSYDRAWRQVLQHEPHLRGTDYDQKTALEQEKELELGYTPGHDADVKKLKTL